MLRRVILDESTAACIGAAQTHPQPGPPSGKEAEIQQARKPQKRYKNAPIVEAVIEMLVTLPEGITLDDLARVHVDEAKTYPGAQRRMALEAQLQVGEGEIAQQTAQRQIGHMYTSADGRRIFQSRFDGFTFSQLAPYDNWEHFSSEAVRLWARYATVTKPSTVNRLGVRYINRLDIPTERFEITDYLRTHPELSPDLPQELSGYFFQVQLPLPHYDATVSIISTAVPPDQRGHAALILDLDCFQQITLDCQDAEFGEKLEVGLRTLRDAKNEVFEACITPTTRRMID
jgi:uncharacterized protein (TIGR04255 family)